MKAGRAIYNILSNDATLILLLTESGEVKVFPDQMPQRFSYPTVVYSIISTSPNATKTGVSRFDQVRVQIDCYARTYKAAHALDDAVRLALDRKTPGTYDTVVMKGVSYLNSNGNIEEPDNVYRVSSDYQIIIDPFG